MCPAAGIFECGKDLNQFKKQNPLPALQTADF
jgi:hypothetical protein